MNNTLILAPKSAVVNSPMNVRISENLRGSKIAVKFRDTLVVSPAMHTLMMNANPKELQELLSTLKCADMPSWETLIHSTNTGSPQREQNCK